MSVVTVIALDLGYRITGAALVQQPGDKVLSWAVIKAHPLSPRKVTEEVRIQRAGGAWKRLTDYIEECPVPDALVYETPEAWIGAKARQHKQQVQTLLALGAAKERMYLALAELNWDVPVYPIEPSEWHDSFLGFAKKPRELTKTLTRKYVGMRTGLDIEKIDQDAIDAIAIGLVGAKFIQLRVWE